MTKKQSPIKKIRDISINGYERVFKAQTMVVAGQQPYEVIHEQGIHQVRHYHALTETEIEVGGHKVPVSAVRKPNPLVLIAPLAVNMFVYDLLPERSFVRYMLAQGFDVYLIDWGKPKRKHSSWTLEHYVTDFLPACLESILTHSGASKLNLHGWSMGGGMALAYAAKYGTEHIQSITTYGTPIDGYRNGAIGKQYKVLAGLLNKANINLRKLPAKMLYAPGWANVIGFKLLDPLGSLKGYWSLVSKLDDRDYVEQHANQAAFIDNLEAYPGGALRDWFCSVWLENETAQGRFTLGNESVNFNEITVPLLAIAGKSDNLANVPCCKGILNVVGSETKEFFIGPGGHIAIMSGKEAPKTIWAKTADWLTQNG